eukprot:7977524-Heterocapsa_arctica.AAC.1
MEPLSDFNNRQLTLLSSAITGYALDAICDAFPQETLPPRIALHDLWPDRQISVPLHPYWHPDAGLEDYSTLALSNTDRRHLIALHNLWIPLLQELIDTCLPALQAVSSALDERLKNLCRSCSLTFPVYVNV